MTPCRRCHAPTGDARTRLCVTCCRSYRWCPRCQCAIPLAEWGASSMRYCRPCYRAYVYARIGYTPTFTRRNHEALRERIMARHANGERLCDIARLLNLPAQRVYVLMRTARQRKARG